MDKLPVEILCKIFYHLDLNDLLKDRLVNKKWNSVIKNSLRIKNLLICRSSDSIYRRYHEFTFEPIQSNHYFFTDNLNLFGCSFKLILKNLKKLIILNDYEMPSPPFNFCNFINQFKFLEHLEIEFFLANKGDAFKLPHLRILSIKQLINWSNGIKLNTPKLTTVKLYECLSFFKFKFPKSIVHFSAQEYGPKILKMINLEKLDLKYLTEDVPVDLLNLLPKLQSLSILGRPSKVEVSDILMSKNNRKVDFKFYFYGLEITCKEDLDKFNEDDWGIRLCFNEIKKFKIILDNYFNYPDAVPYITKVHFNLLIDFYRDNQIDLNHMCKFVNLKKLVVNSPFDTDQLIKFIQNYKLSNLRFINCSLDQNFLDELPNCQKRISKFTIQNNNPDQKFDFKFILQFNYLEIFKTNLSVPCSIVSELFHGIRISEFYRIKFKLNNSEVEARKYGLESCPEIRYQEKSMDFKSCIEMTNQLEKLELSE